VWATVWSQEIVLIDISAVKSEDSEKVDFEKRNRRWPLSHNLSQDIKVKGWACLHCANPSPQ